MGRGRPRCGPWVASSRTPLGSTPVGGAPSTPGGCFDSGCVCLSAASCSRADKRISRGSRPHGAPAERQTKIKKKWLEVRSRTHRSLAPVIADALVAPTAPPRDPGTLPLAARQRSCWLGCRPDLCRLRLGIDLVKQVSKVLEDHPGEPISWRRSAARLKSRPPQHAPGLPDTSHGADGLTIKLKRLHGIRRRTAPAQPGIGNVAGLRPPLGFLNPALRPGITSGSLRFSPGQDPERPRLVLNQGGQASAADPLCVSDPVEHPRPVVAHAHHGPAPRSWPNRPRSSARPGSGT